MWYRRYCGMHTNTANELRELREELLVHAELIKGVWGYVPPHSAWKITWSGTAGSVDPRNQCEFRKRHVYAL